MGCGAYFAYLQHPFDMPSDQLAQALVDQASLLALPGTMFTPEGDKSGAQQMRVAFANIDTAGIQTALNRLAAFQP